MTVQRRYLSQRARPLLDARIDFDLRTAVQRIRLNVLVKDVAQGVHASPSAGGRSNVSGRFLVFLRFVVVHKSFHGLQGFRPITCKTTRLLNATKFDTPRNGWVNRRSLR